MSQYQKLITRPISNLSDEQLVRRIKKNNCNDSLLELIKRTEKLFFDIYHKYYSYLQSANLDVKDIADEKDTFIFECVKSFKGSKKCKFSTYLAHQTRYMCLNLLNRNKTHSTLIENRYLNHFLDQNTDNSKPKLLNLYPLVQNTLDNLQDKRIKTIFNLRYFNFTGRKLLWETIAKRLKTSKQTCINLHNKGKKILAEKLENYDLG